MLQNMSENWDETKNAQRNIKQCENFLIFVKAARKKNGSKEDSVYACGFSKNHAVFIGLLCV